MTIEDRLSAPALKEAAEALFPSIELLNKCKIHRGGVVFPEESPVYILHTCDDIAQHSKEVCTYGHGNDAVHQNQNQEGAVKPNKKTLYYTQNVDMVGNALAHGTIKSVDDIQV